MRLEEEKYILLQELTKNNLFNSVFRIRKIDFLESNFYLDGLKKTVRFENKDYEILIKPL